MLFISRKHKKDLLKKANLVAIAHQMVSGDKTFEYNNPVGGLGPFNQEIGQ